MSRGMKWGIAVAVLVALGAGGVFFKKQQEKNKATEVRMEPVGRKDLVAAVTASGKIEAETKVDISADITGRILKIAVKEGDLVTKGQFLHPDRPGAVRGRGQPRARRCLGVEPGVADPGPGQPRPGQAAAATARSELQKTQPEPDLRRGGGAGAAGVRRRRRRSTRRNQRPGGAGPRRAQGGAGQPGQDPAVRADRRPRDPPRGRGGRGRGARHLLEGDRPADDDRRHVDDHRQGAGGRDRRRPAQPWATRCR